MNSNVSEIKISRAPVDESNIETIDIIQAEYAGQYKIQLWFSDDKNHVVDFKPFLKSARNPTSTKYRNLKKFRQFRLVYGNLHWNDYEMCFSTDDLYNNDIGVEMSSADREKLAGIACQMKQL